MMKARSVLVAFLCLALTIATGATSVPTRAQRGMVASQNEVASRIGADVIRDGGTAVDAAVAVAFALAVVHPTAGNIGGGGFMVYRPAKGDAVAYDFREVAPAKASPTMFMKDGKYSAELHTTVTSPSACPARSPDSTWPGRNKANCLGSGWWNRR
jgi:gamma-glutamyltranspeptidase/glutathione hydrolase